jgi:hypothetical protein
MKRLVRTISTSLYVMSLSGLASTAAAQDRPSFEASGGWNLLHSTEIDETLPVGWYGDIAANVTNTIGIVGQVTGAYKSLNETTTEFGVPVTLTADLKLHTFMGGLRLSARQHPRIVPFAQVLFGLARLSATVEGSAMVGGQTTTIEESESDNELAIEAGGGVNIRLTERVGARFAASYVRFGGDDGGNAFRVAAGIVVPF